MSRIIRFIFTGFFVLTIAALPMKALAAPYYEGKVLTIIVGLAPGGGYDRMARLLAKHLPKYIPGKPSIVVQNMPGAGGIIAANHLYNVAKPDGFTIHSLTRPVINAQLVKDEGVKFDATRYSWIGSASSEPTVFLIRGDLPYQSFGDLLKRKEPIHIADVGTAGGYDRVIPLLLRDYLGLKINLISYPGGNREIILAFERKEIDATYLTYSSNKPYIARGLVRPLLRARVSASEIENLPVNEDLVNDKTAKTLMAIYVDYLSSEECLKTVSYVLNQPEDIVKEFIKYSRL
jgi:tripartite-type tricarboxylate transporter receptor subunit TctC